MDAAKEFFSCLALRHTPGLGPRSWKRLLSGYQSAFEAVSDARNWSSRKLLPKNRAEVFLAEPWRPGAEAEYRSARSLGARVITWFDPKYPKRLREIPDPPALLYAQGDLSLLRNPFVAVVGARECTLLGLQSVERISSELSRFGVTVVSGLAAGIDRQAHTAALGHVGSSIAVLGAGLDVHYPPENEDVRQALEHRGLVITEFGPGTRPEARNFPYRNRIISGLSLGVLVAEAASRSGSLITARLAAEQGREVFALPGPLGQPTFAGCHRLIKQGAALVESAEDIVRTLRYQFSAELTAVPKALPGQAQPDAPVQAARSAPSGASLAAAASALAAAAQPRPWPENLTDDEKTLLSLLTLDAKIHMDSLIQALGWESHMVSRRLLVLEMQGLVRQWPGMYYSLA
ncbi:MAG: DNA-processing protein DprA [Proteobacteria bacterium]|nr:DNA-processing protein DprA [Pseudomonadota bacterium]MBU1596456.1 DNA-processing protein DprA [Pseudomonadota bacterium]